VVALLASAAVIGVGLVAAPAAQADTDPKLTVTAVTLGRTSVAVSGLNTVAVPIRVAAGYDSDEPSDQNLPLVVFLKRTTGTGKLTQMISTDLPRVSGTTQKGEWAGSVKVPSTGDGTFQVTGVKTGPYSFIEWGTAIDPTPFDGPSLSITGYHLPKLTATVVPRVVPFGAGFSVVWQVLDSATGKPYGTRIPVLLATDAECPEGSSASSHLTSTSGFVTKAYSASDAGAVNCLRLRNGSFDIAGVVAEVLRPGIVSAVPSATSAKVGTLVPVNGTVAGSPAGCKVALQRLRGATQWRDVSLGVVRQSGRHTVIAQPAYLGPIAYRVSLPTCYQYQAGVSRTFTIRGL
jgi:hypothetical protein